MSVMEYEITSEMRAEHAEHHAQRRRDRERQQERHRVAEILMMCGVERRQMTRVLTRCYPGCDKTPVVNPKTGRRVRV